MKKAEKKERPPRTTEDFEKMERVELLGWWLFDRSWRFQATPWMFSESIQKFYAMSKDQVIQHLVSQKLY